MACEREACAFPAPCKKCVLTRIAVRSLPITRNERQTAVCEWVMVLPHHFKVYVFHYFFFFTVMLKEMIFLL